MTALTLASLLGESAAMRRVRALIVTVAPTRLPVLVHGPTGTGKEIVAAAIHAESGRRGAFIAFNVCAIGDTMFEDALFGHVRGAYTGAVHDAQGFLREANNGTAFFDEISGLALPLQAKLLRAIELGVFRPIGARHDAASDFRVVAATNERIHDLVDEGRFRADLAHRLGGVVIDLPPLTERVEDIELLACHFARLARPNDRVTIGESGLRLLEQHDWPGNVRELRQVVESAAVFAGASAVIDRHAIQSALSTRSSAVRERAHDPHAEARRSLVDVLGQCDGNTDRAAQALGVHRATIYRRMKRLGIDWERMPRPGAWGGSPPPLGPA